MARRRNEFEGFSITHFLTRPFQVFWKWGSRLASDDKIRDQQTNPVVSFVLFPLRFLFACILFLINSWAFTRHIRPFLFAIPTLLAVIAVSGIVWLDYFRYPNKVAKTQKYYENFLTAANRGPEIARHFAEKKVTLQPENQAAKFDLAYVWEMIGNSKDDQLGKDQQHLARQHDLMKYLAQQRSVDLMKSLADNDNLMAHVWFARRYLTNQELEISKEERSAKIDQHLNSALKLDPENNSAKITLADHFLAKATEFEEGSPEYKAFLAKASEQLVSVSESESGEIIWHLPKLMKVLFDLGDNERATAVFQSSKKNLYQFMRKFPADERIPQIWIVLIGSSIQLKDYKGAAAMIDEGRRQTDDTRISNMFEELSARLLIQQVDDLKELDTSEKFDQALDILSRGILLSPLSVPISNRLVEFILPDKRDGKVYSERLEKTKSVSAPSVAHLLLGIHKVMKGDALGGQTHWKIAETQAANSQVVLFSLIRSLVVNHGDKFENRRDVLALAIEQFPNQGLFYFLRGSDSFKQGNYQLAIPDLQYATEKIPSPGNFEIHVQLARCYKALNDQENLDNQRRKLQKIIQTTDPGQREILENYLSQLDN